MTCACTCLRARAHHWTARVLQTHHVPHATPRPVEFTCAGGGGDTAHAWAPDEWTPDAGFPGYGYGYGVPASGFLSGWIPWVQFQRVTGGSGTVVPVGPDHPVMNVPEPATWVLLASGIVVVALQRKLLSLCYGGIRWLCG